MSIEHNESVYQPLRWTYGLVPVVAGLDKFFNLLADWESYLNPAVAALLPMSPGTFMAIVGVIEIAAGVIVLSKWTRLGAYVVMAWLVLIAVNLLLAGFYDVAVRDLVMAVGAYTLGRLAEVRQVVPVRSPARAAA
jgi:hypothetical protein